MVSGATMLIMLLIAGGLAICVGIVFGAMLGSSRQRSSLHCEQCGAHNRDSARFCAHCGGSLSDHTSPRKP